MKKKLQFLMAGTIMAFGLTACSQTAGQGTQNPQSGQSVQPNQTAQQSGQNAQSNTAANTTSYIGEEKALSIALENAGLTQDQLVYSQVELEADDGVWKYNVEFFADNKEFDYEIEATRGTILSYDSDMEGNFIPPATTPNGQSATPGTGNASSISIEDATKTALDRVPGATSENIHIYNEFDDGRSVYEGKIIYNNMEYDFEIDAATGNITSWEEESVYD